MGRVLSQATPLNFHYIPQLWAVRRHVCAGAQRVVGGSAGQRKDDTPYQELQPSGWAASFERGCAGVRKNGRQYCIFIKDSKYKEEEEEEEREGVSERKREKRRERWRR